MKKVTGIKLYIIAVLGFFLLLTDFVRVDAASYIPRKIWRDDNGDILIQTTDTKGGKSRYVYRTIGWTITRCKLGTQEPIEEQYITVFRPNSESVDIGNNNIVTCFVIKEDKILNKIAEADPQWLADIQSGECCYVLIDAIMITVDKKAEEKAQWSGFLISENNQDYLENPFNNKPGVYDKYNYKDLMYETYGWANPKAIESRFRIPVMWDSGEAPEPEITDEYVTTIGKNKPEFYTWNTSSEYDLSKAIPTGENITNGYGADKWYGSIDIGKHEETRTYTLSYDLVYREYDPIYDVDEEGNLVTDSNGNAIQIGTVPRDEHYAVSFQIPRKAVYYYVMGINVYELKQVNVGNSVYPGDNINYSLTGSDVPMKVILDGEENPISVTDWISVPQEHIQFPEPQTQTIQIFCGDGIGAAENYKAHLERVLYDDVIDGDDPIKEVISWNDLVEINGVAYLDNEKVSHANDTGKVISNYKPLSNGKDDATYVFHEKEKTVKIPEDVANGSYSTVIDVTYKRRILGDGSIVSFSSMQPDSITNHLKPGYEMNEPVYVHTPVISPVEIKDGEGNTQLIEENLTEHTGLTDKDGRVPDNKAVYELILDNNYTFDFSAAMHREIQGYGWSGDPSKYDKYVKGKYVCFPFAVQLKIKGEWSEFYETDDSIRDEDGEEKLEGYTKWIELPENEIEFYIPPWAEEGAYYEVNYRVEATNVIDEDGVDHSDEEEGTANVTTNENNEAETYVATYVVPVELSGIIYDFEIIGTNAYERYNEELESGSLAFAPRKWEKKQGNKNRKGGTAVRYTLDGEITHNWKEVNTLPMSNGTSRTWEEKGYMVGGETFTFSVKTIANLWDENIDGIYIKPTYRWYDFDGTEHRDLQIYYWDDTDNKQLIRYGSAADQAEMIRKEDDGSSNKFSFWNTTLAGSAWDSFYTMDKALTERLSSSVSDYTGNYHDKDLLFTLEYHNKISSQQWNLGNFLKKETLSYCMSSIELTSNMRLLTGKYEELERNLNQRRDTLETFALDEQTHEKFRRSMQTWYGQYTIPANMLVCDADTFETMGITDKNRDGIVDYFDYLVETNSSVDKNADFWLNKNQIVEGYLILNFDIKTVNNQRPHLSYHGGSNDMWKVQGGKEDVIIGSEILEDTSGGRYPAKDIPVKSGDIAVVQPNESIYDRYNSGIHMIN